MSSFGSDARTGHEVPFLWFLSSDWAFAFRSGLEKKLAGVFGIGRYDTFVWTQHIQHDGASPEENVLEPQVGVFAVWWEIGLEAVFGFVASLELRSRRSV